MDPSRPRQSSAELHDEQKDHYRSEHAPPNQLFSVPTSVRQPESSVCRTVLWHCSRSRKFVRDVPDEPPSNESHHASETDQSKPFPSLLSEPSPFFPKDEPPNNPSQPVQNQGHSQSEVRFEPFGRRSDPSMTPAKPLSISAYWEFQSRSI